MTELFKGISYIIPETLKLLGSVTKDLLNNEIFQVTLGMVFLGIIIGLVFYMISKTKNNKSNRNIDIDTNKYGNLKYSAYNKRTGRYTAGYKGLKNGKVVYFEMKWNKNGKLVHDGSKNVDEFLW